MTKKTVSDRNSRGRYMPAQNAAHKPLTLNSTRKPEPLYRFNGMRLEILMRPGVYRCINNTPPARRMVEGD